jgi:hypothetical protein
MTRARWRALAMLVAVVLGAAALALAARSRSPEQLPDRAPSERPALLLLTSLPLVFGEQFSLEGGGSPALTALEARYRVLPISVTDPAELAKGALLMMAQPQAQPPENLVALDRWVRGGGRVLLLADPLLERPSERPLGDALRPPPMFMDTGLLAHWGLRLDAPDERGAAVREVAGRRVQTVSPGALFGKCSVTKDRLIARCQLGKGKAIVVADADLLGIDHVKGATEANLDAINALLAELEGDSLASR